ncbi:hypothetical protein OG775_20115 [Streptomyces platensis]|uniref:hypothetical protein n=1 Tax=Streptomyces platensis TaxID=58346 RepID=UPI00224E1376|nr:hypothetical protein [Streptomyces platensis]MCX4637418.1 hypothetical protein [Streptomyces platensis]
MTNAKIGVALVGGYFLGRTKKAKMALGLGLFLAGKKLNLDPKQLGTLVANSPVLGPLNNQVRKELVDATKAAAGTALTQRMSGLADSLHERTVALNEGRDVSGEIERTTDDDRSTADDEEQAPADDARGDAEDSGDAEGAADAEEKRAPRHKAPAAASAKTATKSSAASAKKSGSPARSTARRPSSSASGTAKSSGKNAGGASRGRPAASPARKTASGARKKASGTARTAADRGGRNG